MANSTHKPCGHWHNGQSDNPVWDFSPQEELPPPYHADPVKPKICGHWHKQTPPPIPCIEYVSELETTGTSLQVREFAPGEQFIYLSQDDDYTKGGYYYGCYDTTGKIFRFNGDTMTVEKETAFAAADVDAFHQIEYYDGKLYALITRDNYDGKWIQKIGIPDPSTADPFTLIDDPLYCGSVTTGTDSKIYGCKNALSQNLAYAPYFKPITGGGWAPYWEELPGAYGYTIDTYSDYAARSPQLTVGSSIVNFKIIPGVGFLFACGPESQFLQLTSVIAKVGFTGIHSITYPLALNIGPHQMSLEPNGSRVAAFRHTGVGTGLKVYIVNYSTDTGNDYAVSGLLDGNGNSYDGTKHHARTIWHSNGRIYNLHATDIPKSGRIVSVDPSNGSVIHQYWIGAGMNEDNSAFTILGDYVYVWQDSVKASDSASAIIKLTLDLELICVYDCLGLLRTNGYREVGGNLAHSGGRYIYNFTRENAESRIGFIKYDTTPPFTGTDSHDPRWPFVKAEDKF